MQSQKYTVVTPPAVEPITLAELKAQARVDFSDNDTALQRYATLARQYVETTTDKALITQTLRLSMDALPSVIYLKKTPVASITGITYINLNGNEQTLSPSLYEVDLLSLVPRIKPIDGVAWPSTPSNTFNVVNVTFVAGYGASSSSVPEALRHAMLLLATHWYNEWTPYSTVEMRQIPFAVDALLANYTTNWVY
jgi:uncharacterized phiE125 gp8 family phage protein